MAIRFTSFTAAAALLLVNHLTACTNIKLRMTFLFAKQGPEHHKTQAGSWHRKFNSIQGGSGSGRTTGAG